MTAVTFESSWQYPDPVPDQMRSQGALLILFFLAHTMQDLDKKYWEEEANPNLRWLVSWSFYLIRWWASHSCTKIIWSEKEVKGVNDRLASLEKTIHTLVSSSRSSANKDDCFQPINIVRSPRTLEDGHNVPFEGASSFTAHSKQVSQAFRSAATSAGLPNESLSTSGSGRHRFNDEKKGPVEDLYELPPMSLVLKTLRAAKSKVIESKIFILLTAALPSSSKPTQILSWSVGFEYHKLDRHVPEGLFSHWGLLYCICDCGELWPMETLQ